MKKDLRVRLSEEEKEAFAEYAKLILEYSLLGAAVGIALTSPNANIILNKIVRNLKNKYGNKSIDSDKFTSKLLKEKYLKKRRHKENDYFVITKKGKRELINLSIDTVKISKTKWDGKWRVVIFDIPENHRQARDILRRKLIDIGFVLIQKSVWICPYECEKEILFIINTYGVQEYVNYLRVEYIDVNTSLQKKFDIS